ncbi:MAG: hypothetical protein JJU36_15560 [Phycisphaeraceae bacterium]|nr:hypothetical protein [Phycisphaeraceae bacterium]
MGQGFAIKKDWRLGAPLPVRIDGAVRLTFAAKAKATQLILGNKPIEELLAGNHSPQDWRVLADTFGHVTFRFDPDEGRFVFDPRHSTIPRNVADFELSRP